MDPGDLSKYEVIFETLSASESDSEDTLKGELPRANEKRKVTKNFIICQPAASVVSSSKDLTDRTDSSARFTELLSDPLLVEKNRNESTLDCDLCCTQTGDVNREDSLFQARTCESNDPLSFNGSLYKEKQKLKEINWANAVNSIDKGGPSMKDIKNVIEGTIFRVLNEDLAASSSSSKNNNKSNNNNRISIDTSKRKCPHCEFQTLSRFSLKKHVALHENKPQLVFSQGIPKKPPDTNAKPCLSAKKFVCGICSDLFRTETALKLHKCASLAKPTYSDIKTNQLVPQNSDVNSTKEPVIVTALKFLSKKCIDIETKKEEIDTNESLKDKDQFKKTLLDSKQSEQVVLPTSTSTCRKFTSQKVDDDQTNVVGDPKDVKYLRTILEEPAETVKNSCPSSQETKMEEEIKIEPYEIVWESVKTECKDELFDENIKMEPEDSQCDNSLNMYDDLERRMAILTGEENNGSVVAQNWMELSNSNGSEEREPIEELPIEIKYNALLVNSGEMNNTISVSNSNCSLSKPVQSDLRIGVNNNKEIKIAPRVIAANHFQENHVWSSSSSNNLVTTSIENVTTQSREFSAERENFNSLVNKWLESYKKIYPNLSARLHVPGGIPCPECQVFYKSFHLLKRHWARIHDPSLPLIKCPSCEYKTNQRALLLSHVKHKHTTNQRKLFPCDKCDKTYHSSSRLMKHKLLNHTDKSKLILYKCEMCTYSAFDSANLHKHFERKHLNNGKNHLCMYCGHLTKSKTAMELHEKLHKGITKNFNCKSCSESFEHRYDLYAHEHIVHVSVPINFYCKSCDFRTVNKELLVVHNNEIHKNLKPFKCSDCALILKDLESLRVHINRKHNPYIPWKYCAHCSYKSRRKGSLASHVVKHLPRKRGHIKCKLCNYRTYKKHYYERHYNIRHNPNAVLYYCYHCSYSNKVKAKLHQHMQHKNHLLTS